MDIFKLRRRETNNNLLIEKIATSATNQRFLIKAEQFAADNIDNAALRLDDSVNALNVSRPIVFRKFRALLDQTPSEFIKSIRLRRAAELLHHQPDSLKEVAYQVGFNDPKYFSKCFKKFCGRSPARFVG